MTRDKFEKIMENMGEYIEKCIENIASKFDKSISRAWNHRPIRLIAKTLTSFLGIILLASSIPFFESGQHTIAKFCLVNGTLIIIANIAELIIFKSR